jgi:hypothetical protein
MSTILKDLNPKEKSVNGSIRTLLQELKHEATPAAETPATRLQRVLKIYSGIKPLLAALAAFPFIPSAWRKSLLLFTQALEALSLSAPEVTAAFKAGKDL